MSQEWGISGAPVSQECGFWEQDPPHSSTAAPMGTRREGLCQKHSLIPQGPLQGYKSHQESGGNQEFILVLGWEGMAGILQPGIAHCGREGAEPPH